jgi:hypothetical protein
VAIRQQMELESAADEMLEVGQSSPSSPSDAEVVLETERRGLEDEAKMVDFSIGELRGWTGDRGAKEKNSESEVTLGGKRRKGSIRKIKQLTGLMLGTEVNEVEKETPRSPLKQQSLIEDCEIEGMMAADVQIEEVLRARSDLLRKLKDGEVAEFGDEY